MYKEESHGSYRPFTVLTFKINYLIHGLDPLGYHLVNILLHIIVTALFQKFANLFISYEASLISSILFACHPIHVEAVTGVVGRAELLSAIIFLVTFLLYKSDFDKNLSYLTSPSRGILLFLLIFIGTLCKEQCITIVGILILYEAVLSYKLKESILKNIYRFLVIFKRRCLFLTCILFVIIYFRISVMGMKLPTFSKFSNPAAFEENKLTRLLTYIYLWALNAYFVIIPTSYCCDWSMGSIPLIESFLDYRNAFTLLFFYIVYQLTKNFFLLRNRVLANTLAISLIIYIVSFLPSSNLFFPVGFVLAERVLYIPSIGYCLFIGFSLDLTDLHFRYLNGILRLLIYILIIVYSIYTHSRIPDWTDEYTLYKSGIEVNPNNAKLWNNLAHVLEARGPNHYSEALRYCSKAAEIQPDDVGAHINVARILAALDEIEKARSSYKTAIDLMPKPRKNEVYFTRVEPKQLQAFVEYAGLLIEHSNEIKDHSEAEGLLKRVLAYRAGNFAAHKKLGLLYHKYKRFPEALQEFHLAAAHNSMDPDAVYNIGVVMVETKKFEESVPFFRKAIHLNPDHKHAMLALASILSKSNDSLLLRESLAIYNRLEEKNFEVEQVLFSEAMIATDLMEFHLAEKSYDKLLSINQNHVGGLFNMALLLVNELGRPLEAVSYLERIISFQTDHFKSHLLLGDLYMTHFDRMNEAETLFKNALQLQPGNIQAAHNLCILYAKMSNYKKSLDCLKDLLISNPENDQIRENYNLIVKRVKELNNNK